MLRSVTTLLTDLFDYAGLFPPAKLDMQQSVEAYNRAKVGANEFALSRFICPASRLTEFTQHASALLPGTFATSGYREQADVSEPWRLSVLIDGNISQNLDLIEGFNAHHSKEENGQAIVDMVEIKVANVDEIDAALDDMTEGIYPFFEFPVNADCRGYIAALAGSNAAAKIRTGGVTASAFPTAIEVAQFIVGCAKAGVAFKATAGLHHPIRAQHKLTYEKDSASCTMHGFINLFVAAALVKAKGLDIERAEALLLEEANETIKFGNEFISWQGHGLDLGQIAKVRETFALSFGSCSFDEPIQDLTKLGLM